LLLYFSNHFLLFCMPMIPVQLYTISYTSHAQFSEILICG